MKRLTPARRSITAHHEAGHAVISWCLGVEFDYVELVPQTGDLYEPGQMMGRIHYGPRVTTDRQEMMMFLAGPAAEAKRRRWRRDTIILDNLLSGEASDCNKVYALAREATGEAGAQELFDRMYDSVNRLVEKEWGTIQSVAQALIERQRLTWTEFRRLTS